MNSVPSLHDLQHWLQWVITDPRGVREALLNPHPDVEEHRDRYTSPTESQLSWIEDKKASVIQRLDVYAEGYFLRLLECLAKDFPKTKLAIGDDIFSKIVAQYLKAFPSNFTSIDEVGSQLAHFISQQDELPYAWVPDLALLEWNQIEAFYAHETKVTPDWHTKIGSRNTDSLRFQIHPSVRLLKSKWSLPNVLEALEAKGPLTHQANFSEPSFLIVYRHEDLHCWDEVKAPIFEVLQKIQSGQTLDESTSHLEEKDATELSQSFSRWVQRGVLPGINERLI